MKTRRKKGKAPKKMIEAQPWHEVHIEEHGFFDGKGRETDDQGEWETRDGLEAAGGPYMRLPWLREA